MTGGIGNLQWQQTGRRFVRALEQGGRVIRLDKRGTGLSDQTSELPRPRYGRRGRSSAGHH